MSPASSAPSEYDGFIDLVKADLDHDPSRVRTDIPSLRDIPTNTGDIAVAELAKEWFDKCKQDHFCDTIYGARNTSWYPKRLVHICDSDRPPRLIIPEDSDDMDGGYATLSHCWGENPDFLTLNSENIDDFTNEIPLLELAASFQDAILTCRRLGICYLWIDCLCILQDGEGSHADWLSHAHVMDQVYLNCELNIAINPSKNPHEGAFRSRNTDFLQDCYVWTKSFTQPPNEYPPILDEHSSSPAVEHSPSSHTEKFNLCAVFSQADFTYYMRRLPLSTRAWVLQEKLLSPRTLHFREDRISWECQKAVSLTEFMPDSIANSERRGFDCLYQSDYNILGGPREYDRYVTEYSDRDLSHPREDKLVAFSAIARRCALGFGDDDKYCAGLFRSTMPSSLLWHSFPHPAPKPRPSDYRAPSWSWASLDQPIRFHPLFGRITEMAEMVNVTIQLADPSDPFGQIESASLTITGPLISCRTLALSEPSSYEDRGPPSDIRAVTGSGSNIRIVADDFDSRGPNSKPLEEWFSYLQQKDEEKGEVYLLSVAEENYKDKPFPYSATIGIAVQRLQTGSFTRVGRWETELGFIEKHSDGGREFQRETITII